MDLKVEKLLESENNVIVSSNLRRLKTTSVGGLKKYQEGILKELDINKYEEKIRQIKQQINKKIVPKSEIKKN